MRFSPNLTARLWLSVCLISVCLHDLHGSPFSGGVTQPARPAARLLVLHTAGFMLLHGSSFEIDMEILGALDKVIENIEDEGTHEAEPPPPTTTPPPTPPAPPERKRRPGKREGSRFRLDEDDEPAAVEEEDDGEAAECEEDLVLPGELGDDDDDDDDNDVKGGMTVEVEPGQEEETEEKEVEQKGGAHPIYAMQGENRNPSGDRRWDELIEPPSRRRRVADAFGNLPDPAEEAIESVASMSSLAAEIGKPKKKKSRKERAAEAAHKRRAKDMQETTYIAANTDAFTSGALVTNDPGTPATLFEVPDDCE